MATCGNQRRTTRIIWRAHCVMVLCLQLQDWVFVKYSLGAVAVIVHIVAGSCRLMLPWHGEDSGLDTKEKSVSVQHMRPGS